MSSSSILRRCLVVEDDPASTKFVSLILSHEGWMVTSCRTAEEAEVQSQQAGPDLFLLDLGLPGMDGLTFCRRLRAEPRWRDTVIVVCTARNTPEDFQAVLDAGADDYLTKPLDPAMLRVRLRMAAARVDRNRQRRAAEREASIFKFTAEASRDAFYWADPRRGFRFVWANDAACRHFHRRREELLRMRFEDCDPTLTPERVAELHERLRTDGSCVFESLHTRGDGSVAPVEVSANIFLSGSDELVTGYIRDLSEQKANQATLARAALLLARMSDAVFCTDLDGTVTFWNEAAERLYGWSGGELLGRSIVNRYPVESAAEARAQFSRIAGGQDLHSEILDWRKDGSRVWTEATVARFTDPDGRPAGVLGIARDISERKRTERERAELEHKLQETQRLESLGVLAGGIAHDFNNLLTGVLGNASLARLETPVGSSIEGYIGQIEEAARRAADLCQQMLAYSGKGQFIIRKLQLSRLVNDTAKLLKLSISKRARLVLDLGADLPAVMGDATQLRQVVMNLVINASEAIASRDGTITVSTRLVQASRAELNTMHGGHDAPEGQFIRLEVRDNGCGMNEETLGRIFEPFFTTKFTGRGLGLSAVLGIVRGHKGALDVASRPGEGTTFSILIPAVDGVVAEPKPVSEPGEWRGSGHILVADDEPAVREVAAEMLGFLGFRVDLAPDGREAIALFRRNPGRYAAVLLDLTMPHAEADEVVRDMHAALPDTPVIIMTGHETSEVAARFAPLGIAGVISKPFSSHSIQEALRNALSSARR